MKPINRFCGEEEGNDAAEYALVLTFIAVAIIAAAINLGTNLGATFQYAVDHLP